jgi:dihydroorotate dehydrogenase (NAD+) catalytic subunit
VGTASFLDPGAAVRVIEGLEHYCSAQGVRELRSLTGALELAPGKRT